MCHHSRPNRIAIMLLVNSVSTVTSVVLIDMFGLVLAAGGGCCLMAGVTV